MLFEPEEKRPLSNIDIGLTQRTGKKVQTVIRGLANDLDYSKILAALRNRFQTSGSVSYSDRTDDERLPIAREGWRLKQPDATIIINGDHRQEVKKFFIENSIWAEPDPPIRITGI